MFPLRDENPTVRTPAATIFIIALNVLAWVFLQGMGSEIPLARSLCLYSMIPGELFGTAPRGAIIDVGENLQCRLDHTFTSISLLTHMFMHGSWFHIIGNMWFLWIFGDNVEDSMGSLRFVVFYLLCGLGAAGAQLFTDPGSLLPMVGASGAIGGVMGAYARLYPRAHVTTLIFLGFYMTTVAIPAIAMLGYWFIIQIASGLPTVGDTAGGVAFWAHVGGFVAGLILVGPMHRQDYIDAHRARGSRATARHRLF